MLSNMDSVLIRRRLQILELLCKEYSIPRAKRERIAERIRDGSLGS